MHWLVAVASGLATRRACGLRVETRLRIDRQVNEVANLAQRAGQRSGRFSAAGCHESRRTKTAAALFGQAVRCVTLIASLLLAPLTKAQETPLERWLAPALEYGRVRGLMASEVAMRDIEHAIDQLEAGFQAPAALTLAKVCSEVPRHPGAYLALGWALLVADRPAEAARAFERAARLAPARLWKQLPPCELPPVGQAERCSEEELAWLTLVRWRCQQANEPTAAPPALLAKLAGQRWKLVVSRLLDVSLATDPHPALAAGWQRLAGMRFREAMEHFANVLVTHPDVHEARYGLAIAAWGDGRFALAAHQLRMALDQGPTALVEVLRRPLDNAGDDALTARFAELKGELGSSPPWIAEGLLLLGFLHLISGEPLVAQTLLAGLTSRLSTEHGELKASIDLLLTWCDRARLGELPQPIATVSSLQRQPPSTTSPATSGTPRQVPAAPETPAQPEQPWTAGTRDAAEWIELAARSLYEGNEAQARICAQHAEQLEPTRYELLRLLPCVHLALGECVAAGRSLRTLLEHSSGPLQLGWQRLLSSASRYDQLAELLQSHLSSQPATPDVLLLAGALAHDRGEPEQALAQFTACLHASPTDPHARRLIDQVAREISHER
jgi:tetratricopeptide (TPR) repeat protein